MQQREIDIANLNELNEFIVQHLRESILVVDELDRIRLINETAARLLRGGPVVSGAPRSKRSRLACCSCCRRGASRPPTRRDEMGEIVGGWRRHDHSSAFCRASRKAAPGPVLVFLEDTSALAERTQQSKLASLGRLAPASPTKSAIRSGAMSHASQLLREAPAPHGGRPPPDRNHREERDPCQPDHRERAAAVTARHDTAGAADACGLADRLRHGIPARRCSWIPRRFAWISRPTRNRSTCSSTRRTCTRCVWNLCDNAFRHGAPGSSPTDASTCASAALLTTGRPFLEVG